MTRLLATARELTGAQRATIKVLHDHELVSWLMTAQAGSSAPAPRESIDVAIMIDNRPWGHLCLADKDEGEFQPVDEETAVVLARWAEIAVSNAREHFGAWHAGCTRVGIRQP